MALENPPLPGGQALQSLVSGLGTLLRYFTPGFVTLFVWMAADPSFRPFGQAADARYPSSMVLLAAGLLGVGIYGIHVQFLHQLFWWRLVLKLHLRKKDHPDLPDTVDDERKPHKGMSVFQLGMTLDEQRWRRRASLDPEVRGYQGELSTWGALLHFLYCASYALLLVPVALGFPRRGWWFLGAGLFLFFSVALTSDYREAFFELRAARVYFIADRPAPRGQWMCGPVTPAKPESGVEASNET